MKLSLLAGQREQSGHRSCGTKYLQRSLRISIMASPPSRERSADGDGQRKSYGCKSYPQVRHCPRMMLTYARLATARAQWRLPHKSARALVSMPPGSTRAFSFLDSLTQTCAFAFNWYSTATSISGRGIFQVT